MLIFRGLSEKYLNPTSTELSDKATRPFLPPYGLFLGVTLVLTVVLLVFVLLMPVEASKGKLVNAKEYNKEADIKIRNEHADYTDKQIVNAIRKAEGNWNYGIISVKCHTEKECRQICFNTVKKNRVRFRKYGYRGAGDFIQFLSSRYAPIGAGNDPQDLNRNWQKNVRYFLAKDNT